MFGFLVPKCECPIGAHRFFLITEEEKPTLFLITDLPKIGTVQLRQSYDALRQLGIDRLVLVSQYNITAQTSFFFSLLIDTPTYQQLVDR